MSRRARYRAYDGGPDPLAPPYDLADVLARIGDDVLAGAAPERALADLLSRGLERGRGLSDVAAAGRRRAKELRRSGTLDGTLEQVRELLNEALAAERDALAESTDPDATLAEAELDLLPPDTAGQVRALAERQWLSPQAEAAYQQIRDLLREEVVDAQFRGMRDALAQGGGDIDAAALREMITDLTDLLDAHARGEDTTAAFDQFMAKHGQMLGSDAQNIDDLIDEMARRSAAAARMMASMSAAQRAELADLMAQAVAEMGLAEEFGGLADRLRALRPELDWSGRQKMTGERGLRVGEAAEALADLADAEALADALADASEGSHLGEIDAAEVERLLGRQAAADVRQLARIARELEDAGYLVRDGERLTLSPRAIRSIAGTALKRVFARMDATGAGAHDVPDAGATGEPTGSTRPWHFGDAQPVDAVATVRNAVLRSGPGRVQLTVEDFAVTETERRSRAAVALCVDMSWSMVMQGTWGAAKSTALALHALVTTKFPQDVVEVIGFCDYARVMTAEQLATADWDRVQGTNLSHALALARRHVSRFPDAQPVVLVVTDGEPTAHLNAQGRAVFSYPPEPETIAAALAEVDALTRLGATITVFMLDDDPSLVAFVDEVARRNGGRVMAADPDRLGEYVVSDYLRSRRGRRRGA